MEIQEAETKEDLIKTVEEFLTLPKRAEIENNDGELPKKLGRFLVERGYIKNVAIDNESWEFKYESEEKIIYISQEEMPPSIWRDYAFRKQTTLESGRSDSLFPMHPMYNGDSEKNDLDIYRFLQQTVSAYQEYLKDKESLHTPYSKLFTLCYTKRKGKKDKYSVIRGFSTWGSMENEEDIQDERFRASRDVNELLTIYLWNPKYFDSYINYLKTNATTELYKKGLVKIDKYEAEDIKEIVTDIIAEMKEEIKQQ